jgi:Nif-specific regulatory protein
VIDQDSQLGRIGLHRVASEHALELLVRSAIAETPSALFELAMDFFRHRLDCEYIAVVRPERGRWRVTCQWGVAQGMPDSLVAETLDAEHARSEPPWAAAPLVCGAEELLLVCASALSPRQLSDAVDALAALLGVALAQVRRLHRGERRIQRLEAVLRIAGQWNQSLDMQELLTNMAQASTNLFECERASIFLWDRCGKVLIGRPALGVEGNELRIPENRGVVGHVVQSGEPALVDVDSKQDQSSIDREVDRMLGFETRSLLCVPLRSRRGDMLGAFELINKRRGNFTLEDEQGLTELAQHAAIALENTRQREQLIKSRKQVTEQAASGVHLIGNSAAIERIRLTIERIADTELSVLILGENGTGKEVASRLIHYLSSRRDEPFIAINCAALTETLLESELFGHEKGAFTDAHESRAGKFELANGGTLFLDEIGDMSLSGQAKLLRVLEERVVVRVGGSVPIPTDARVIAATNQDLAELVRSKKFREDLFFRLNVVALEMPALRQRGDDILQLAEHFLDQFCTKARRAKINLDHSARQRLLRHDWPGNVRELRNLMERLAYLSNEDDVTADGLAFVLTADDRPGAISLEYPLTEATHRFQVDYIRKQIEAARGNMTDASRRLGLHRSNLYRKMRQLGMPTSDG